MNLDKFQSIAVKANGKSTLIVAPPGSGKTTVILGKVNHLIEKENISPKNILVITFTKAAAKNMEERYKRNYAKENTPFFGTFHGLFYKILIRIYKNISIINSNVAFFIIKKELEGFSEDINENKVKEILNLISLKKTGINLNFTTVSEDIFDRCFKIYEDFKEKNNLLDFNDLQKVAYDTLSKNKNMLNYYKKQFKYILVDEFQDCDITQINFLKLIGSNIFCVGDEDQCIYSFRGSSPIHMVRFSDEFKGGEKIYLKYNYRSAKNIVDLSKGVIKKNKERNDKEVINYKEHLGKTKFYRVDNEKVQGKNIGDIIIKDKKENFYRDNIVLYRTNIEARSIIDAFIRLRIPFKVLDSEYNFYNHSICKDLLSYLNLAINSCDKEAFNNIINKPFRYVSKNHIQKVLNHRENRDVFDLLIEKSDIHPFQLKNIIKVQNLIKALNKKNPEKAVISILNDLNYMEYIKTYCTRYKQDEEEILNIIEEFKEAASEFKTVIEFLNHVYSVEKTLKNKEDIKDSVSLSTIHGVKGMEFKNVFIINAVDDYIPHKSSNNLEEERRIFYVGITRAIDNLYIYSPKTINRSSRKITRFMDDLLVLDEVAHKSELNNPFKSGQKVLSKTFGVGSIEDVTKDKLKVFFEADNTLRIFSVRIVLQDKLLKIIEN